MSDEKATKTRHILGYSDKLMDHFENPRNMGSFDEDEENVVTGIVGSPACGDTMRIQIKIDPETEQILDVKFKTYGCGSAVASTSLLTEWIKGKTLTEAMEIKNLDIANELDLPPVKVHCSILAQQALNALEENWHKLQKDKDADLGDLELHHTECSLRREQARKKTKSTDK
jgi:nitrogen fixation NifU-like protein